MHPERVGLWRNRIAAVLYDPKRDEQHHHDLLRRFAERFAGIPPARAATKRDPERRLRVGYVSSDLIDHPIARNLEPVLANRDRARFETIVYAEIAQPDARSTRLQGLVDGWRQTVGLTDGQLAEIIRADAIDILVCLATRLDKGRPLIASHGAAPVQVSFHDPGTSGVPGMDYLIGDPVLTPRGGAERFSERVVRVPRFYVHAPLEGSPGVGPAPSIGNGYVTFGSFNNPAKLNDGVLGLWGEVLRAVPGSRLQLKFKNWFGNAGLRERMIKGVGVAGERIRFGVEDVGTGAHVGLYNGIDIALDPTPFTGSTTTFEALWMGVPVVTLLGSTMAGRWSAAMLGAVGLGDLIAKSREEYVAIAARLAGDQGRRTALREALQGRVAGSSLCDGRGRARQIERLYRALWRRWCASAG
jgi:predicted O-linked N-acetylglucosamine transferase (SPINDLY family)